jgi:hypothetical protein
MHYQYRQKKMTFLSYYCKMFSLDPCKVGYYSKGLDKQVIVPKHRKLRSQFNIYEFWSRQRGKVYNLEWVWTQCLNLEQEIELTAFV